MVTDGLESAKYTYLLVICNGAVINYWEEGGKIEGRATNFLASL